MTAKTTKFRHLLAGGYASDYGPSADVGPNQAGDVIFPYLIEAENIFFELDGGPHKIGGTSKLNSSVIESGEEIRGLVDFWIIGTAYNATQQRVCHAGTKILADAADGTFVVIKTGLTDNAVPCYSIFNDKLIISSDSLTDVPLTYDGTTVSNVGGTPPQFAFSCVHKNRVWVAGDATNPSRVSYCAQYNADSWEDDGAPTAGHFDINPDDGDRITGIASHKNELWVFKGPYKGSIYRIAGSANTGADSFQEALFINGLGAVSHNTIFRLRDDLGFMWSDGTVHSLAATAAFGDFNEAALSRPIHQYIRDHVTLQYLHRAWAVTNVNKSIVAFALPIDTGQFPNQILMMDYSRQSVWWAKWPALNANCIASVIDQSQGFKHTLMIGGRDGYIRKTDQPNRAIDDVTGIAAKATYPYTNYGNAVMMKTLNWAAVSISPKGNYNVQLGWTRDNNAQQTATVTQGGGDVLAPAAANQFTLDTSILAGSQYVTRFFSIEEGGEFRSISYEVYNAGVNEDMEIHAVHVAIEPGAESLENE